MKIDFLEFKKGYEVYRRCDVEHYSYIKSIFLLLCDIISSSSDREMIRIRCISCYIELVKALVFRNL